MSEYARNCSACGTQISCNMYGMGRCQNCGFNDNPIQDDNNERAANWRREKGIRRSTEAERIRDRAYAKALEALRSEELYRDLDLSVGQGQLVAGEVADYIERRINEGSL